MAKTSTYEDEELEAVALESTRTIDMDAFVPHDSIEWVWLEKPHYLTQPTPSAKKHTRSFGKR